jgi:hypothetical protein
LGTVDQHLKLLASASLAVSEAEEAVDEGAVHRASERLDDAREALGSLRDRWPSMTAAERRIVGGTAAPVRERLDATAARVPRLRPVSEMAAPVVDPEQESDPEAA